MSLPNQFSYHFYPVGQGLFATGSLYRTGELFSRLTWVYDCGTSSSETFIDRGLDELSHWAGTRPRIDLLVISHFDHDHIGGISRLLARFEIGVLMLPYMPLAQRLLLAFEESVAPDDPLAAFAVNPVAYLLALEGVRIERILFVGPSDGEGPPLPEGDPVNPEDLDPERDTVEFLNYERGEPDDPAEAEPFFEAAARAGDGTTVEFLYRGQPVRAGRLWEFVPYNDDPKKPIDDAFCQRVDELRDDLLHAANADRKQALDDLKAHYDKHFGSGSKPRNIISLFLYSGPMFPSWNRIQLSWPRDLKFLYRTTILGAINSGARYLMRENCRRCSLLYTGDGYLEQPEQLQRLVSYLDPARIEQTGVFQVMHHGSKKNWHEGVADRIDPLFSVFSSDPDRGPLHHPDGPVVDDFKSYGPIQVDKDHSFSIYGRVR